MTEDKAKAPGGPGPEDVKRAEQRLREEMARLRREEEKSLQAVKLGCIGIIVLLVLVLVALFLA